jgi:hypothetical protein
LLEKLNQNMHFKQTQSNDNMNMLSKKELRIEFRYAFNTKNIDKINEFGELDNLTEIITDKMIVKYVHKSFKHDRDFFEKMTDGIFRKYDPNNTLKCIIDINDMELLKECIWTWARYYDSDTFEEIFEHARKQGRLFMAEFIFPYIGKDLDKEEESSDSEESESDAYFKLRNFIDKYPFMVNENEISEDAFIITVANNRIELVSKILDKADFSLAIRDNFAFQYACDYGYFFIVEMLLKYDDVNIYSNNAYGYEIAKRHGYTDIMTSIDERNYNNATKHLGNN